ncbi:MAG: FkbM family methyltransferase [Pseudomonadales bacterium]
MSGFDFKTLFDVGCNVGDWSLMAAEHFSKAHIHTFELSNVTYEVLANTLSDERFINNNCGLSDAEGTIHYKDYGPESKFNTLLGNATYHDDQIAVTEREGRVRTGNAYCAEHGIQNIDFLKVDVEGAEHMVLNGFSELLSRQAIRAVQFEYGYTNGDAHFLMRDFYQLFEGFGYQVGKIHRDGVQFQPWSYPLNNFKSGPNFLAVKSTDSELISAVAGTPI